MKNLLDLLLFALGIYTVILCVLIGDAAPRKVTIKCGGRVVSEFTTTNPIYCTWESERVLTTNGFQNVDFLRTNRYW